MHCCDYQPYVVLLTIHQNVYIGLCFELAIVKFICMPHKVFIFSTMKMKNNIKVCFYFWPMPMPMSQILLYGKNNRYDLNNKIRSFLLQLPWGNSLVYAQTIHKKKYVIEAPCTVQYTQWKNNSWSDYQKCEKIDFDTQTVRRFNVTDSG